MGFGEGGPVITFNLTESYDNNYPLICTSAQKTIKLHDMKYMQRKCVGETQLIINWLFCENNPQVDLDDVAAGSEGGIAWRRDYAKKGFASDSVCFYFVFENGDR